jgi:hypothetical protein
MRLLSLGDSDREFGESEQDKSDVAVVEGLTQLTFESRVETR